MSEQTPIERRKDAHIDLCLNEEVSARSRDTLLGEVQLLHDSLPELDVDSIALGSTLFGRAIRAPFQISGMTGGTERARSINRELARAAQQLGVAFGVGSQRPMLVDPKAASTYQVRDLAPDVPIFGNVGAVQAAGATTAQIAELVEAIGADALCVHLNPGQELIQPEGDRDFRGCLDAIARLQDELPVPVIAKETGCGLSPRPLDRLKEAGVGWVDTSGVGGTTWIGVEALRAPPERAALGELLWDWGTPTAASICWATRRGFRVIGSGGVRSALDAARALALGAELVGMAMPWLKAADEGGAEAAIEFGQRIARDLRAICALTGSADLTALRAAPRVIGPNLARYIQHDA